MVPLLLFSLALGALAIPQGSLALKPRVESECEYYGSITTDLYSIVNHVETHAVDLDGDQCISLDGSADDSLIWSSTFTWGRSSVLKSYPNVGLRHVSGQLLSTHESIPASWEWR